MAKDKSDKGKKRKDKKDKYAVKKAAGAPGVKLARKKNGDLYFQGQYDKVTIKFNAEAEYKIGLFFCSELAPENVTANDNPPDEVRMTEIGREIWDAYRQQRYEDEDEEGLGPEPLPLADGQTIPSYRSEEKKERRVRLFFIMAAEQPGSLEIRQEIKGGKKMTMIKLGNGAHDDEPIIDRREIIMSSHIDEDIGTLLRGLLEADLSEGTRQAITHAFNEHSLFVPALQSDTMRDKSKNIRTRYTAHDGTRYVVVFEPAFDLGSGTTMAGQKWPIREYEGEVKGVYEEGSAINIKDNPEAGGLTAEDIKAISEDVLTRERHNFVDFAKGYLAAQSKTDPDRYGDIKIRPIYKSKSRPGVELLEPVLESGGEAVELAIAYNQQHGFTVHESLLHLKQAA